MRRLAVFLVVMSVACPAFADTGASNLKAAIARVNFADQARPNAASKEDNPYYWPSVMLLTGGGLITLWGLTHDTGVECSSTVSNFSCGTTKSKAVIFTGLGVVSIGAVLFHKAKSHPDLMFGPRMVGVRQQVGW